MSTTHVRELLLPILRKTVGLLAATKSVNNEALLTGLEAVQREALLQMTRDRGVVTSFVSAINLLVDCFRGYLDTARLREALNKLDTGWAWNDGFPIDLLRNGAAVTLAPVDLSPVGCTAINWSSFLLYYAAALGYNRFDDREVEQLWNDLTVGYVHLPMADIHLADSKGASSTWVTTDHADGKLLRTGDPNRDIYDAIGLTWQPPNTRTRAVLVCCRLADRARASGSLLSPTAVDGWGNLLFVPRHPKDRPWPDHGAAT